MWLDKMRNLKNRITKIMSRYKQFQKERVEEREIERETHTEKERESERERCELV